MALSLSLKPKHLKRYKDIALLLVRYGRANWLATAGLEEALTPEEQALTAVADPTAEALAGDLEAMGPIFVKLGQVLSSRADLLPPPYLQALARLQDQLEPFSFAEVEEIIQDELHVRLSKAFAEFDPTPIAAASLGQVHRARLREGQPVAVKVQRPGIRKQIVEDLEALEEIAAVLDRHTELGQRYHFTEILEEFRKNLARELDYLQEAHHLIQIGENLSQFDRIIVPRPIEDYTTSRVLTMEYIAGKKINEIGPLAHLEQDFSSLAEELFRAYLQQVLIDGLFHADPHLGNLLVTEDGRLALIDLGMVGRVSPTMQDHLLKLLLAVSEGRGEEAADLAIQMGEVGAEFNEREFRRKVVELVTQHQGATADEIQIGRVLLEFAHVAGANQIALPTELTLLSKALLHLDEVARHLAPKFEPNEAIRRNAGRLIRQRLLKSASPRQMLAAVLETKEFVEELPRRVNRILDAVATNQLRLHVDAIDETTLVEGFQKVANRITMGLILAALILGAALLMPVQTSFRIFGYPGLAILCFLAAAGGGFWLVLSILLSDRNTQRQRGRSPSRQR